MASGSFHQSRPFCQLRLRFCRAVVMMRSQDRLMSFELRDPCTRPIDGQIGWLQPRMKASPAPRRIACMPRRYASTRVAFGSWKRPPCMAPQKFASSLKYVQPHSRRIVANTCWKCSCVPGCVPSSAYHGPRRQPPKVTRSDRSGAPPASLMNQSRCCWKSFEPSSATKGATQMAGSKPRRRIRSSTFRMSPPKAAPVSSQSPIALWYPSSIWMYFRDGMLPRNHIQVVEHLLRGDAGAEAVPRAPAGRRLGGSERLMVRLEPACHLGQEWRAVRPRRETQLLEPPRVLRRELETVGFDDHPYN